MAADQKIATPNTLSIEKKRQHEKQEHFLTAFAELGTVSQAAMVAGCSRVTVYAWDKADAQDFKERWEHARHDFRESLEKMIMDRLISPQGNRGSDVLLMFKAKAEMPEKYRELPVIVTHDSARDLIAMLRAKPVDAEFRELTGDRHETSGAGATDSDGDEPNA